MQGELADIQKRNVIEDLESESLSYITVREFLLDLKERFGGGNKTMKVAELKKVEQKSKTIEELVQKFRNIARESSYKERNNQDNQVKADGIKKSSKNIEQWYKQAKNLNRYWRESRREEERLRERREIGSLAQKTNMSANAGKVQQQ